jgi:hypothetical protein
MGTSNLDPVLNGLHGVCRQLYPLSLTAALAEDGKALSLLIEDIEVRQVQGYKLSRRNP